MKNIEINPKYDNRSMIIIIIKLIISAFVVLLLTLVIYYLDTYNYIDLTGIPGIMGMISFLIVLMNTTLLILFVLRWYGSYKSRDEKWGSYRIEGKGITINYFPTCYYHIDYDDIESIKKLGKGYTRSIFNYLFRDFEYRSLHLFHSNPFHIHTKRPIVPVYPVPIRPVAPHMRFLLGDDDDRTGYNAIRKMVFV